jgi:serine/threonine-protein kinase RsbW
MLMLGVEHMCISDIELAVTEACTNVLKHVAETNEELEYEVSVQIDELTCRIRVLDRGGDAFDHNSQGRAEAHREAEGGRGIFIMRAMVDELSFESEPEQGAMVHLVKELRLNDDSVLKELATSP